MYKVSINAVNCRVFDSLSTKGFMMVGKLYGLSPRDLWKVTRRINQPEVVYKKGEKDDGKTKATQETTYNKDKGYESACKSLGHNITLISI